MNSTDQSLNQNFIDQDSQSESESLNQDQNIFQIVKNQDDTYSSDGKVTEQMHQLQLEKVKKFRSIPAVHYLFLMGIFSVGIMYYNNNFQGLLKLEIINDTLGKDNEIQFQLFQTLSSGPTIPFILFGGVLIDKIGLGLGMGIYLTIMCIGTWIVAFGGYQESFWTLIIGRVVANLGLELGSGAESSLLAKWHTSGDLAIYNGVYLALVRIAQLVSAILYPRFYNSSGSLFFPLLIGAIVCTFSYGLALFASVLDIKADKEQDKISKLRLEGSKKKFKFSDIKKYDSFFWIVIVAFIVNFAIYYPFIQNMASIMETKFKLSSEQNGDLQSIAYLIGISSPFAGFIIKKRGGAFKVLIGASLCSLFGFFYLGMLSPCRTECFYNTVPFMIFFGLFITLFSVVLIPAVANASPVELVGTAYGIAYALKNAGEATVPLISVGPLLEAYEDNMDVVISLFIGFSLISLFLSIVLYVLDRERSKNKTQEDEEEEEKVEIRTFSVA